MDSFEYAPLEEARRIATTCFVEVPAAFVEIFGFDADF